MFDLLLDRALINLCKCFGERVNEPLLTRCYKELVEAYLFGGTGRTQWIPADALGADWFLRVVIHALKITRISWTCERSASSNVAAYYDEPSSIWDQ